ncbi:hypothetical protein F5Y13DRAFT_28964 [Hypoxylon sp. FL1857]|nr:hypothetical protein F5Y13DRAFT_28964 [Hypoxylon sp. FL1857]
MLFPGMEKPGSNTGQPRDFKSPVPAVGFETPRSHICHPSAFCVAPDKLSPSRRWGASMLGIEMRQGNTVLNVSVNEQQRGAPNRPVSGATDIPEEFFEEIAALKELEQPFKEVFDVEKLRLERVLHWLMRTVLVSHQELCALAEKGVFFMGNSVHAEPVLEGEGAGNAITDGIELAKCISTSGPSGVQA